MAITQNDIIYFLIVDRFFGKPNPAKLDGVHKERPHAFHGGNIDGIIEKIPYFKKLGITALWLNPLYRQVENQHTLEHELHGYHGYWPEDFLSIDAHFYIEDKNYKDSKAHLKNLVNKLHQQDIKIILDVVVTATGYFHPALFENDKNDGSNSIKKNWFFNQIEIENHQHDNYTILPEFDLQNIEVIDYHINAITRWIEETGIDGIRIVTTQNINHAFWKYFKTQIQGRHPSISVIGEIFIFNPEELADYQKYWGFDHLLDFPMQEIVKRVFADGQSMNLFCSPFNMGIGILEKEDAYCNHNRLITLLDNHDLPERIFTAVLNQHQNNAQAAAKILKLALTFLFTIRGIPQIYYGTEIAMQGHADPDNRRDFNWRIFDDNYSIKEEFEIEKKVFTHTQKLIKIRKNNPALWCGTFISLYVDFFIFAFLRYHQDNVIIVIFQNGWAPMPAALSINLQENPQLPDRIKKQLHNTTLTCGITSTVIQIDNGLLTIKLQGKISHIFK